jgi:hypothetical protein
MEHQKMSDDTTPEGGRLSPYTVIYRGAGEDTHAYDEYEARVVVVLAESPAQAAGRALARAQAEQDEAQDAGHKPDYQLSSNACTFGISKWIMGVYSGRVEKVPYDLNRSFNVEAIAHAEAALSALRAGDSAIRSTLFAEESGT